MQMQDFCEQMEKQLATYEESVAKIEARLDAGGTEVKQQILPVVGDIKNLVTELRVQKERLEKECPAEWSDEKSKIEDLVGQIGSHMDRAWGNSRRESSPDKDAMNPIINLQHVVRKIRPRA